MSEIERTAAAIADALTRRGMRLSAHMPGDERIEFYEGVARDVLAIDYQGAVDALEVVREQLDTDPLLVALGDRLSRLRAIVDASLNQPGAPA